MFYLNLKKKRFCPRVIRHEVFIINKSDLDLLSDQIPAIHIWRRFVAKNLFIE
jgi:hypothetical protein